MKTQLEGKGHEDDGSELRVSSGDEVRHELEGEGAEDSGAASGTDDSQALPPDIQSAINLANSGTEDNDANDFDMG